MEYSFMAITAKVALVPELGGIGLCTAVALPIEPGVGVLSCGT